MILASIFDLGQVSVHDMEQVRVQIADSNDLKSYVAHQIGE